MVQSKKVVLLYLVLCFAFIISVNFILPKNGVFIFIIQYALAMLIFSITSNRVSFIIFVVYILASAIIYLIAGFINKWDNFIQLTAVLNHFTTISNIAILYASVYMIKELEKDNKKLKEQVDNLIHYIGSSNLLTKQEFIDRRNLLIKAMERRKESGYEVYFSLDNINSKVRKAVFDEMTSFAIETFRFEYDLVAKWDDFSFVVLLQNTDESGMKIAINRYFSKIKQYMNIREDEINIDIIYIGYKKGQVETA